MNGPTATERAAGLVVTSELADPAVDLLMGYGVPDGFVFHHHGRGVASSGSARTIVVPGGPDQVARAAELAERALAEIPWHGGVPPIVVGALPFDGRTPAVLSVPRRAMVKLPDESSWWVSVGPAGDAPWRTEASGRTRADAEWRQGSQRSLDTTAIPSRSAFTAAVAEARRRIRSGPLQKVVVARMLVMRADAPFDRPQLIRRLREREPNAYTFAVHGFVGASPELLVARWGDRVTANPLAGTTRRAPDAAADAAASAALLASGKDRREHALVVDAVVRGLTPACRSLDVPDRPTVLGTGTVWHLSTEVRGALRDPAPSALRLASLLHPTPAVCGTPTEMALAAIGELEPFDRTLYAGLVGWMDARGDGEWAVALRCAEVQDRMASLFAGAGIVADSDPEAELAETDAKFGSMLGALGANGGPGPD